MCTHAKDYSCHICEGILPANSAVRIKTHDALFGNVDLVGYIRYWDEAHQAYEVNVFVPIGKAAMHQIHWWTLAPSEIQEIIFIARRER